MWDLNKLPKLSLKVTHINKSLNKSKPKKKCAVLLTVTLLLSFRVNLFIAPDVMTTSLLIHGEFYLGTTFKRDFYNCSSPTVFCNFLFSFSTTWNGRSSPWCGNVGIIL